MLGQFPDDGQRFFLRRIRDQFTDIHGQCLGLAPAVHSGRARIPAQDPAVQILHQDGVARVGHHDGKAAQGLADSRSISRAFFISVMSKKVMTAPSITLSSVR